MTAADSFILLSTAIVLRLIEERFADLRDTWGAVVAKSEKWLESVLDTTQPMIEGDGFTEWVSEFLRGK